MPAYVTYIAAGLTGVALAAATVPLGHAQAPQRARTDAGRDVVLRPDGTWVFADPQTNPLQPPQTAVQPQAPVPVRPPAPGTPGTPGAVPSNTPFPSVRSLLAPVQPARPGVPPPPVQPQAPTAIPVQPPRPPQTTAVPGPGTVQPAGPGQSASPGNPVPTVTPGSPIPTAPISAQPAPPARAATSAAPGQLPQPAQPPQRAAPASPGAIYSALVQRPRTATANILTTRGDFRVWYNPALWRAAAANADGRVELTYTGGGQGLVVIIPEGTPLPLAQLRTAAIENARRSGSDARIAYEQTRRIGNRDVLLLQIDVTLTAENLAVSYLGHYFGDPRGSVQVVGAMAQRDFAALRPAILELLDGLDLNRP